MRLIDADSMKADLLTVDPQYEGMIQWCIAVLDAQPTVELKKGKWIKTGQSFVFPKKFRNYSCSECGYDVDKIKFNFCPYCGADMRGDDHA